jgi:hypothetical protein
MEPFGHRESSLFAEPTENKSFSERNPVFFSTKLEMIHKVLTLRLFEKRVVDPAECSQGPGVGADRLES